MADGFRAESVKTTPGELSDMTKVIEGLVNARPDLIPETNMRLPGEPLPENDLPPQGFPPAGHLQPDNSLNPLEITITEMMTFAYIEVRMVIQWAKKIPDFRRLTIQDQESLLKASFLDISILRLAYRSCSLAAQNKIRFAEGLEMPAEEALTLGWDTALVTCTLGYIRQIRSLSLDKTEFAVLNAIVLTYPDAKGVKDKKKVTDIQSLILDCLHKYIIATYPTQTKRYTKIVLRLTVLRELSAHAKESFFKLNVVGILPMDQLVGEMFSK